jgi:hypothetical protein
MVPVLGQASTMGSRTGSSLVARRGPGQRAISKQEVRRWHPEPKVVVCSPLGTGPAVLPLPEGGEEARAHTSLGA